MFTQHERKLIEDIQMTDEQTEATWRKILQKSQKNRVSKATLTITTVSILLFLLLLPPLRTYAEELWKKSWFYSNQQTGKSEDNQETGEWIVFPASAPVQDKIFTSISEISNLLSIPILTYDNPVLNEIYYQPILNQKNQLVSLHLWGHNKKEAHTFIPKKDLYTKFTDVLTESQRADIERIYKMDNDDIASYYSSGLSYSASMYSKESGAAGDIRVLAPGENSINYFSKALQCDVLIEKQIRYDGTYMTYATWVKDNILYNLIGYRTINEMKEVVESMHY